MSLLLTGELQHKIFPFLGRGDRLGWYGSLPSVWPSARLISLPLLALNSHFTETGTDGGGGTVVVATFFSMTSLLSKHLAKVSHGWCCTQCWMTNSRLLVSVQVGSGGCCRSLWSRANATYPAAGKDVCVLGVGFGRMRMS